jgi:hypothetical protein
MTAKEQPQNLPPEKPVPPTSTPTWYEPEPWRRLATLATSRYPPPYDPGPNFAVLPDPLKRGE